MSGTVERLGEMSRPESVGEMPVARRPSPRIEESPPTAVVTAARRLNRAAGTIAASVLIDSAMEHYRGNFHNKAMRTPLDRGKPSSPGIAQIGHARLAEAVPVIGEQLGIEQGDQRHRIPFVRLRQNAPAQCVRDCPLFGVEEARHVRGGQPLLDDQLYWTDKRVLDGPNPIKMGGNNSGKAVGGSTVHYAMVALRFRPEWFKSRTTLGYGADWPISWEEMWHYYGIAERQINISGPLTYPWGPKRPRYPYRAHELNTAGKLLAKGCEVIGIDWTETPLATLSAPHAGPEGKSPPCAYRGFCRFGCTTNAKRSALTVWIPRALAVGAEVRDLAMVGRIEMGSDGRATGVPYHRDGSWHFQRAKNVVVAGYAVETPRLLLNSANESHPDGLANGSGLVGKNLMTQSNAAVWGRMDEPVRWYKGPPSLAITEHWNYDDNKEFHGGYCWMGQGPLPIEWMSVLTGARGLWGEDLRRAMLDYNQMIGVKMVGEMLPNEANRVTLADDLDQYGLRVARITYAWGENDKALVNHALEQMGASIQVIGAKDMFRQEDDTCHLGGTARMGNDPRTSVVDADCRSWDIPNLWVCDGSVFPTVGGVNPSLTIQAIALRTADRIGKLAAAGEL